MPRDLRAVVLVCRWWREVGEVPRLWGWVYLFVMNERSLEYLPDMLCRRRLQAVRSVEVQEVWEEWMVPANLLQAVVNHPALKEVIIKTDLSSIDNILFANTFAKLDKLELRQCKLTTRQVSAICTTIGRNSQVKSLDLSGNRLSRVEAGVLARAVAELEEVDLGDTGLTPEQVEAVFAELGTSSQLEKLTMNGCNLSSLDPGVMKTASMKLEVLKVRNTRLTPQQVEALYAGLSTSSRLKVLDIECNRLSSVDPDVLAAVVNKLETTVMGSDLTPLQATAIFTGMAESSKLKDFGVPANNFSSVDAGILARAVTKLERADLDCTLLTPRQVEAIFAALDTTSQLKSLHMCIVSLSSVDPDVLARVVNRLEKVEMWDAQLTGQQLTSILTQSIVKTNLKQLNLAGNSTVDQKLVKQATKVIPDIILV